MPTLQWTLERLNWQRRSEGWRLLPGSTRLKSFDDPAAAEAERQQRETEHRTRINPFRCGGPLLHCQTSLDRLRFHDWLLDTGLTPPPPDAEGKIDWISWWESPALQATEWQRAKIWEALDKVRFFIVREQPRRAKAYVVVRIYWEYNDSGYDADAPGGVPVKVFRRREAAEAHCRQLEAEEHRSREGWYAGGYDIRDRLRVCQDPFTEPVLPGDFEAIEQIPFHEVIEIDLEEAVGRGPA